MKDSLIAALEALEGRVGFYYKNLDSGEVIAYREEETFWPASVIKLPIFMHLAALAAAGGLSWSEKIQCRHEDKLGGCGALRAFSDEPLVSIDTLCELMITISDNSATNLLIRRVGQEALNQAFLAMGLKKTRINRLLFDSEAAARGLENEVSPLDMAHLLEEVYRRRFVNEATSAYVEEVLKKQQINHKIPGIIGRYYPIAHKTGEDDGITNDVALVLAPSPFILCFMSNDTCVPRAEDFIRKAAYQLFKACGGDQ